MCVIFFGDFLQNTIQMFFRTFLSLLIFSLLFCLSSAALNQAADAAIRQAIKSAVLDGLNAVQNFARINYWYYLYGSQRVSYSFSILSQVLNYIVLFKNYGGYYRVNCNIDKFSWKPLINNFVKIQLKVNLNSITSINTNDSQNNSQYLTNQNINASNVGSNQTSSKPAQFSDQIQVIKPLNSSNQGIIMLPAQNTTSVSSNLSSNNHLMMI